MKSKLTNIAKKEDDLILPEVIQDRATTSFAYDNNFSTEERQFKENPVINRCALELFKDSSAAIVNPVFKVKKVGSGESEKWRFFENNKNTFTLEATSLSKKEKQFLYSVEGIQFLLAKSKNEGLTVNGLKKDIKNELSRKA